MSEIVLDEAMKERIARTFEISDDPDHPGLVRVYNKRRRRHMVYAFENVDVAMGYIACMLLDEDHEEKKKAKKIDPRLHIMQDIEHDWIIHLKGPASFGTWGSEQDALPFASDLSRLIISADYYADPTDPDC